MILKRIDIAKPFEHIGFTVPWNMAENPAVSVNWNYDRDGLLDLFIVEDVYQGGSSRLYRNLGEHRFEDVTEAAGLPLDVHGLGLATGDVNRNGWTDCGWRNMTFGIAALHSAVKPA